MAINMFKNMFEKAHYWRNDSQVNQASTRTARLENVGWLLKWIIGVRHLGGVWQCVCGL